MRSTFGLFLQWRNGRPNGIVFERHAQSWQWSLGSFLLTCQVARFCFKVSMRASTNGPLPFAPQRHRTSPTLTLRPHAASIFHFPTCRPNNPNCVLNLITCQGSAQSVACGACIVPECRQRPWAVAPHSLHDWRRCCWLEFNWRACRIV